MAHLHGSLFDSCIAVILGSLDLLRKSSRILPKKIAQYILFQACSAKDYTAVEAVVRSWSHPDLSFDFMQNRFCRRKKELSKSCIEAHNYLSCTQSTCDYTECIPSIMLGLFNNLQSSLKECVTPPIRVVDLSKIRVTDQSKVAIVCKLIGGEFPVIHSSDYVNSVDKKAFSEISKPKLSRNVLHKVVIKLNINIGCQEVLVAVKKMVFRSVHFTVVYSGIGFSSSDMKEKFLKHFDGVHFNDIYVDPLSLDLNELKSSLCLAKNGTLWLNTDSALSVNIYRVMFSRFQIRTGTPPIQLVVSQLCNNFLIALMAQNAVVKSFSVLPSFQSTLRSIKSSRDVFGEFLYANSEKLEYLQLHQYWLTVLPLDSLQKCTRLRVLSVTTNAEHHFSKDSSTAVQIFEALQHLRRLEYFEWSESLNLFTKDVLALHNLLTTSLPRLQHWHWKLVNLMLSTTDLVNDAEMKPLGEFLTILMRGKSSSPSCTTYKFGLDNYHLKHWLETLRPKVCFCYLSQSRNHSHFM